MKLSIALRLYQQLQKSAGWEDRRHHDIWGLQVAERQ